MGPEHTNISPHDSSHNKKPFKAAFMGHLIMHISLRVMYGWVGCGYCRQIRRHKSLSIGGIDNGFTTI